MDSKLFNLPFALKITVGLVIILWCLIAIFPLLWIIMMSIKLPVDSFASNPLEVILGPATKNQVGGLSILNLFFFSIALLIIYKTYQSRLFLFISLKFLFKNSLISFFVLPTLKFHEVSINLAESLFNTTKCFPLK